MVGVKKKVIHLGDVLTTVLEMLMIYTNVSLHCDGSALHKRYKLEGDQILVKAWGSKQ